MVTPVRRVSAQAKRRPYFWGSLAALAVSIVIGGTAAFWVFPQRASASNCDFTYTPNTVATDNPDYNAHHGVSSTSMHVYNYDVTCIHISSLEADNGTVSPDWMEVGWVDADNGLPYSVDNCTFTGDDHPHVIRIKVRNGTESCTVYNGSPYVLTGGTDHSFGVADQNGDMSWTFTFDGTQLGAQDGNNFSLGASETNGERHSTTESADAHFAGLRYMATDGWHPWAQVKCFKAVSDDPVYNNQRVSDTEVNVSNNPPVCP